MKGLFINGEKMPTNCVECKFQFGGFCSVQPADVDSGKVYPTVDDAVMYGRPTWCPLEEVDSMGVKIYSEEDMRNAFNGGFACGQESQQKQGKWIDNPGAYECSACGILRAKGTTGKYNYCPSCGAKMKGG